MRNPKLLFGAWLLIFSLAISGCNLFPDNNKSRPAPNRPKMSTPTRIKSTRVRPAPTKRTPALSSMTEKDLMSRLSKIDNSVKKSDWATANRETNTLGGDMVRFRPTGAKGKTLRQTANFDTMYAKLQADVKMKNKTACLRDIRSLQDAMRKMKPTTGTPGIGRPSPQPRPTPRT